MRLTFFLTFRFNGTLLVTSIFFLFTFFTFELFSQFHQCLPEIATIYFRFMPLLTSQIPLIFSILWYANSLFVIYYFFRFHEKNVPNLSVLEKKNKKKY